MDDWRAYGLQCTNECADDQSDNVRIGPQAAARLKGYKVHCRSVRKSDVTRTLTERNATVRQCPIRDQRGNLALFGTAQRREEKRQGRHAYAILARQHRHRVI